MTRLSSIAGLVAMAAASLLMHEAEAHIYQLFPTSRQFSSGPLFKQSDDPNIEYCPHCYDANGPVNVRARAELLTDPEILSMYGGGEFPLKAVFDRGELAENGNYIEPQEISVRHGVCGDPREFAEESSNVYSTPNSNWPVIDSFSSGQVVDMTAVMRVYHFGHLELFVCDANDQEDGPDSVVTQRCLNMHPLTRAPDDGGASPIDPNYPGRYYVDPECRVGETDQTLPEGALAGYNIHMRYVLPDIECDHCILQLVYYTGNSCKHVGYDEFEPESWPSQCAPEKEDWIELDRQICGENGAYPEEFWACSDISIARA